MEDRDRLARGIFPRGWPGEPSQLHAECLIEGIDPSIQVSVKLLQRAERHVLDASGKPVSRLMVADTPYENREETVEYELSVPSLPGRTAVIETAGSTRAALVEKGKPAGTLLWRWDRLHATVEAWSEELDDALRRVRVEVANRLEWDGASAEPTAMQAFYATQVLMHTPDGAFASLADPPQHLREHSAACRNEGLWPVPVGEAGDRRTMLASQAPQEDYPATRVPDLARRPNPTAGVSRRRMRPSDVRHAA